MYRLKSIKLYFFSILKLFFLSFRNYYFSSNYYNKRAGVSLNPETSVDKVLSVLKIIDLVLIMSVNPGFGGQKFIEKTLEKVKILRKEIDSKKLKTQIEIDGGINFENSNMAIAAGIDILVSGTTIFKENGGNLKKNIQLLKTG